MATGGLLCHHTPLLWKVTVSHFMVEETEDFRGKSPLVSMGPYLRVMGMSKHRTLTLDGQKWLSAQGGHCTSRGYVGQTWE